MSEPVTAEQAPRDGWRHLLVLLAMMAVGFLGQPYPAAAGVQSFIYHGQAFDPSACFTSPPVTCVGGSISGFATFDNGTMSDFGMSADGLTPTLGVSDGTASVIVSGGAVVSWSAGLSRTSTSTDYEVSSAGDGFGSGNDFGLYQVNSPLNAYEGRNFLRGRWSNPKSFGIACNAYHSGAGSCGEPIDLGSGNVFDQVTDYETAGQNKLSLIRYYNSMATPDTYATGMGVGWRTNYDRYLRIFSTGVLAERPDGQQIGFTSSSGTYTPDSDIDLKLTKSGGTWTLTDRDDNSEIYFTSGSEGVLQSVTQRNKYTQALTYSHGQIAFVSDSYTRKLTFGYSGGLLTTVSTPEFTSGLTYGYVAFASAGTHALQTVTYATSPNTHQTYLYENANYPYALTGITDENGNRYATWSYDGLGRGILSQLSGAVNYTSVYYNDANGNRVVKGPLGIVETYKFATLQGVPKVIEIDRAANSPVVAASETFAYDSNGYRSSMNDWNGNNTSWVNNSHGMPTQISFISNTSNKQITNITYDFWYPHLKHTVSSTGLKEAFTYSSSGNLLTDTLTDKTSTSVPYTTNGQTRTTTFTYNGTGQLLTVQLPRTDVTAKTTFAYTGGTLTSITDALSHVTTVNNATAGGRWTKITDPNSVQTTFAYKTVREWPTSSVVLTSAGSLTTSLTYDSAGNLTRTTPDGSYLAYGYDNAHRPNTITNILGESQAITYNSAGNVTQTLWKNASSVTKRQHTATYDALGEKLTDVGGMSQSTAFAYDKNGNVLMITDPLSHVTTQTFDQLNRLATHKDAAQNLSSIKYDSHSRPLTITDPRGNVTSYVYDGFGDTIQQTSPNTLKTIYFYDGDSNLTGQNQTGINFSSATYDAIDRILTRTYPADSTLNVAFTYDQAGHGKGVGHLTSLTDQVGSLSRSYDERGNIITDARTITGNLYSNAYTYESAGRLSSITYASSGWIFTYDRDTAGQITAVRTNAGHGATTLATSVTHMPFGPLASLTWSNGVTDARTFDLDYRMTSVKDVGTGNILYLSYGYDADNNVHTVTDNVTPANNQTLTWDVIDRLTGATGSYTAESIAYDSNSNRKTYTGTTITHFSNNDLMKKWGSSVVAYDSAGNMTGFSTRAMTYSKANRLASANSFGTANTYAYDAFGQSTKVKTGTTPFSVEIYDLWGHLISETSHAATPVETDYIYLDDMPLTSTEPSTSAQFALHTDRIGTPQFATNSTKTVVWTGNYDPFGSVTPTTSITMNLRFPGMYSESTGYYRNGFRDYFPGGAAGYLEADLLDRRAAPFGNSYNYANQNPMKYIDPNGLLPEPLEIAGGAALGGYIGYNTQAGKGLGRELKGLAVGTGAGIVASFVTPALSGLAAKRALAFGLSPAAKVAVGTLTFTGTNATIAATSTLGLNYWTGEQYLSDDVGYSALIAGFAPLFSLEALGIGGGLLLDTSTGARVALSVNSGVFGTIGTLADRAQQDKIEGAAHPTLSAACQVSTP
jgi:RHS repeat-associated protein